ncbi:hypothetical protein JMUB7517_27850 [Staphylococcus aureus]
MQRSLVGSEMCIRDRPSSSGNNYLLVAYDYDSNAIPVSYTHLTLPTKA